MAIFLSVPEAAHLLKLSKIFLYIQIRSGKLPHYKFSSHSIRVDIEELKKSAHSLTCAEKQREALEDLVCEKPIETAPVETDVLCHG